MLKAITVTAVKMVHSIWTLPINRDVCTVLVMVEHSAVNRPMDLLHQPLKVFLSMKQASVFNLCSPQSVLSYGMS